MIDIKVTIEAKELAEALNNLANAMLAKNASAIMEDTPELVKTKKTSKPAAAVETPSANKQEAPASPVIVVPAAAAPQPQAQPTYQQTSYQQPYANYGYGQPQFGQQPYQQPNTTPVPVAQPAMPGAIPTAGNQYTLEQLMRAAAVLSDAGRATELHQLLASFGIQGLTQLRSEHYSAFAAQLIAMGAKI